jgi:hypothetical protein
VKRKRKPPPWTPFAPAVSRATGSHIDPDGGEIFMNSRYTVSVKPVEMGGMAWPDMVVLSIKRNDKAAIFDWRDMQKVKNELVGPEHEGIQLFPAESRLVDAANQVWIFVLAKDSIRFPFGFPGRYVSEGDVRTPYGFSTQRPFEPSERPADCVGPEEAQRQMDDLFAKRGQKE